MEELYFVTGAYGHLGNVIVNKLLSKGYKVRAFAVPEDKGKNPFKGEVNTVYGNICNSEDVEKFLDPDYNGKRYVIHAAGIVSISSKYSQNVYDVNVGGTKNVLEACKKYNVDKLVYVSSVHAIPIVKGGVTKEVKKFNPEEVEGLYARTKAEATQAVMDAAEEGLNACVVHPSGIIGPYDYGRGHLTQLIIDFCKGRLTSVVKGGYDFVDVRDIADGVIEALESGKKGETYILSNRYYSIKELMDILSKATGKKAVRHVLPMWFAKLTAPFAELYYKILRQPPLYTAYSLYTLSEQSRFSHEKATKELGYTPHDINKTVADTYCWLKKVGRVR